MCTAIIHLSDLHLVNATPDLHKKFLGIATSLEGCEPLVKQVIILVSGDIADTGAATEYEAASSLFKALITRIKALGNKPTVTFFAIPGNHDCDLSNDQEIRELVLAEKLKNPNEPLSDKKLEICLEPQINFYKFIREFVSEDSSRTDYQVAPRTLVATESAAIGIIGLNTALFTQKNENQGKLVILNRALDTEHIPECDILICTAHHPVSWLTYECMDQLKSFTRARVDFYFSGHEHRRELYIKNGGEELGTTFCEAGAFSQKTNVEKSHFSICLLDHKHSRYKVRSFHWAKTIYALHDDSGWIAQNNFKGRRENRLPISSKFGAFLNDPGAQYVHPRVEHLRLGDFFIPTVVKSLGKENGGHSASFTIDRTTIHRFTDENGLVLIFGPERFGKTSLAKHLFDEFYEAGRAPLYYDIRDLKKPETAGKTTIIENAAKRCYAIKDAQEYYATEPSQRVLIIDNFGLAALMVEQQRELIATLRASFPVIIILGNEILKVQIASGVSFLSSGDPCITFEIQELSYKGREQIIRKWCGAGIRMQDEEDSLERRIRKCMEMVETVLGQNLLPSTPFFVLVVLQLIEAETPVQTANSGSYGFIYEYLITQALAKSNQVRDLNLKYSYLSELSYKLFKDSRVAIDESELKAFHSDYIIRKKIDCDLAKLMSDFVGASIFGYADGVYIVRYRYLFYYFTARYISERFHNSEMRGLAFSFIEKIHNENNFNILVFLVYLVKDPALKESIIANANGIYSDIPKFDFREGNEDILSLGDVVDNVAFDTEKAATAKDDLYEALSKNSPIESGKNIGDDEVGELVKLNKAFKSIQLLGQTVKNFVGSMDGEEKIRFVEACYDLSLRTASSAILLLRSAVPELVNATYHKLLNQSEIKAARMKVSPVLDGREVYEGSRELVYRYAQIVCLSVVKKVSFSIGSPELEPVYEEVAKSHPGYSYDLINTAIKLDHFRELPLADIRRLATLAKKDLFIGGVVRRMVLLHFYLFPVKDSIRAQLCHELGIDYSKASILAQNPNKMLPSMVRKTH
jgi:predicted MPP superfamily phosphohydrolase